MVACCPSHADSSSILAVRGDASTSNRSAGIRSRLRMNEAIWRVRDLMMLEGRSSPPGTASRTASHSCGVRFAGSVGHVLMTPTARSARHFADRRARPVCSCAMRTMRSLTFTPSAGATVQPRRRSAIQAFDGSVLPPASCPEASVSTAVAFQCSAVREATMPDTRSTHQPTRSAPTEAGRTSPVFSSTAVSGRRGRRQCGMSRPRGAAASGSSAPLSARGAVIRSTTLPRKGHVFDRHTHIRHRHRYQDTRHDADGNDASLRFPKENGDPAGGRTHRCLITLR